MYEAGQCSESKFRKLLRESMVEVLETFVLALFGHDAILQTALHPQADVLGSHATVGLGIGLGLGLAVFVAGHTSGGHVSPAISLSFALFRGFPWKKVPVYFLAQFLGSLLSAGLLALFNYPAILRLEATDRISLFASMPPPGISHLASFFNICAGTAILLIGVSALLDPRNHCPSWFLPIGLALLVFSICIILPSCPLNPAWDLAFRLVAHPISGSARFDYSYPFIPILAPLVGGPLGVAIYDLFLPEVL